MAAIFYKPLVGTEFFKGDLHLVSSVYVDFLQNFIGSDSLAIVTQVGIQNSDTIQYIMTFDDVINFFYFGKGMGSITISGMLLSNGNGELPGAYRFHNDVIGSARGKRVKVSMGNTVFVGVISNFGINVIADPNVAEFTISLSVVNHNIPNPVNAVSNC